MVNDLVMKRVEHGVIPGKRKEVRLVGVGAFTFVVFAKVSSRLIPTIPQ